MRGMLYLTSFSALQRAEIAEIRRARRRGIRASSFSALQRAEIAENLGRQRMPDRWREFQCSSTSRNC